MSASAIPAEVREAALRGEPDRYVAATLAPVAARPALAAIAAFSAELARIPASVSEPMLGDIRLQWWRDALAAGRRGEPSGHPVADALVSAERRHGLAAEAFEAMIDARELDLSGGLPPDDAALRAYLEPTEGQPFRLALAVVGVDADTAGALGQAAGIAYGIARSLSRLPMLHHNGGLPLPADRLRAAGIDPARLGDRPLPDGAEAAVARVADELRAMARERLALVRKGWRHLGRAERSVLLPLAMVEPYFRAQSGRAVLLEMTDVGPLTRFARIGTAHVTGRI